MPDETAEQILYIVNTQVAVLATDADNAIENVKNGQGSVISRGASPKPQPQQPPTRVVTGGFQSSTTAAVPPLPVPPTSGS